MTTFGTEFATQPSMLVAVPNGHGRVSPVFDEAARLRLLKLEPGTECAHREVVLFERTSEGILRNLKDLGVEILICGAISQELRQLLEGQGIRVVAEIAGDIELVLAAFQLGQLNSPQFIMPGHCSQS
jgi:predicted Fe-Mo cluster-binding NifX family protein